MNSQVNTVVPARMMRASDVAQYTGLSESYLAKLRCTGDGPTFRKVGRAVLYDLADVQRWLDGHSRASTSDTGGAK